MKRLLAFLLLTAAVGCSGGVEKLTYANVTGTVTFNGQPIDKGQITFALEGRPPSTIDIVDGKFAGQAAVGSNRIIVLAKRKTGAVRKQSADEQNQIKGYMEKMQKQGGFGSPPADYDPSMVDYIPADWGQASKQTRVVESGQPNDFKFEIKGTDAKDPKAK